MVNFAIDLFLKFLVTQEIISGYAQTGAIIVNVAVGIAVLSIFLTFVRIIFFPFFIIDKHSSPFESIKLSLATTKGNFIKLLMILLIVMPEVKPLYLAYAVISLSNLKIY